MKIKEAIPFLERTVEALKVMPQDIDVLSVNASLLLSEQYASIHVTEAEDMKKLAPAYGSCVQRSVKDPDENGAIWTWLQFASPDAFLRFVQCDCERTAPSDATTGGGMA